MMRPMTMRTMPVTFLVALLALASACGATGTTAERPAADGTPATSPASSAASCPEQVGYPVDVPAPSVTARDLAGGRLVPEAVPSAAVLCRYVQDPPATLPPPTGYTATFRLEGSHELDRLDALANDLQVPPKVPAESHACTLVGGPTLPYLLRLDYPSGSVWVGTSDDVNSCSDVSNGVTSSSVYLGADFAASYSARRWTRGRPRLGPAVCDEAAGRYGQQHQLVPAGAVRIRVCTNSVERPPVTDADAVRRAAGLINRGKTTAATGGCEGQVTHSRELLFEYTSGRGVLVHVLRGCNPSVFTSSLSTDMSDTDVDQLFEITG